MANSYFLVSYVHQQGYGRGFYTLSRPGLPRAEDITHWEDRIEAQHGLVKVCVTSFQPIEPPQVDTGV